MRDPWNRYAHPHSHTRTVMSAVRSTGTVRFVSIVIEDWARGAHTAPVGPSASAPGRETAQHLHIGFLEQLHSSLLRLCLLTWRTFHAHRKKDMTVLPNSFLERRERWGWSGDTVRQHGFYAAAFPVVSRST